MFNLMLWFLLLVGWFELLQPSLEFGGNMLVKMKTVGGSVVRRQEMGRRWPSGSRGDNDRPTQPRERA